jgi:hypothetical protein
MNLTGGRDGSVFTDIATTRAETVVSTLKRNPTPPSQHAIATALRQFSGPMVRVDYCHDTRQWRYIDFRQQTVDVRCNPIEMIIGIDLTEVRSLDVTTHEIRRRRDGRVQASAAPSGFEQKVSVCICDCVADRRIAAQIDRPWFGASPRVMDLHVLALQ